MSTEPTFNPTVARENTQSPVSATLSSAWSCTDDGYNAALAIDTGAPEAPW